MAATGTIPMEGVWHTGRRPRWMRRPCTRRLSPSSHSRPVSGPPSPRESAHAVFYHLPQSNRLTAHRHHSFSRSRTAHAALNPHSRSTQRCEASSGHIERRDQGPNHRAAPQRHAPSAPAFIASRQASRIVTPGPFHTHSMRTLTKYSNFNPMPQLATPPPDSPAKEQNGTAASNTPALSPFASMLLQQTDVSFTRTSLCPPYLLPY